jgi:hypothetical protein
MEIIISILAGIVTIALGANEFVKLLRRRSALVKPSKVFVRESNIFIGYPDGSIKQLTHLNTDVNPILLSNKSKIIFFRSETIDTNQPYTKYKLMSINVTTLEEETITDQKPFSDGLEGTFEIIQPRSPILSHDQTKLLFIIEKYATGSQLVSVDIATGKWTELFSVEKFEVIQSGSYKGKLLVGVSEIGNNGRDIFYKVCDFEGKVTTCTIIYSL